MTPLTRRRLLLIGLVLMTGCASFDSSEALMVEQHNELHSQQMNAAIAAARR